MRAGTGWNPTRIIAEAKSPRRNPNNIIIKKRSVAQQLQECTFPALSFASSTLELYLR
jgi:hypothetical protein